MTLFELYNEIWNERPHRCYLTNADLHSLQGTEMWLSCFAHVVAKSKNKDLKFNKDNIILVHPDVHRQMDFGTAESLAREIGITGMQKLIAKKKAIQ